MFTSGCGFGHMNFQNNIVKAILTWIGEFRPGNKTICVVFEEESDVFGPRRYF